LDEKARCQIHLAMNEFLFRDRILTSPDLRKDLFGSVFLNQPNLVLLLFHRPTFSQELFKPLSSSDALSRINHSNSLERKRRLFLLIGHRALSPSSSWEDVNERILIDPLTK
jgi:hypothetical protein